MPQLPSIATDTSEPTLETALRKVAAAQLPSRVYQLLHFAFPWGAQMWVWGWHRSSAWLFAIGFFGVWALCEKRRQSATSTERRDWRINVLRPVAALLAGVIGGVLVLEGFVHLLSILVHCPGCAG